MAVFRGKAVQKKGQSGTEKGAKWCRKRSTFQSWRYLFRLGVRHDGSEGHEGGGTERERSTEGEAQREAHRERGTEGGTQREGHRKKVFLCFPFVFLCFFFVFLFSLISKCFFCGCDFFFRVLKI